MTGFGVGVCELGGRRLIVEIRAVNHRFFDLKLRLPWSDAAAEAQLAAAVRRRVDRGALTLQVRDESGAAAAPSVRVNVPLARQFHTALEELRRELALSEPVTLALVAEQRDVITVGEPELRGEALFQALEPGLEAALADLGEMRRREGETTAAELRQRGRRLGELARAIEARQSGAPVRLRDRLTERLAALQPLSEVDPNRLAQEIALIADRIDIAEELARLRSHLDQLEHILDEAGPVGRRLDFLLQEMGREVNTMAAKAQDSEIAIRVVDAKAELEKMREQVQNVE
jgi:uncharacterized protein (TIGR00255 family)